MSELENLISTLPAPFNKLGNIGQMVGKVQESLRGQNPEQYVRDAMNNGTISQEDFNKAAKIANMIRPKF